MFLAVTLSCYTVLVSVRMRDVLHFVLRLLKGLEPFPGIGSGTYLLFFMLAPRFQASPSSWEIRH